MILGNCKDQLAQSVNKIDAAFNLVHSSPYKSSEVSHLKSICSDSECYEAAYTILNYLSGENEGDGCSLLPTLLKGDPDNNIWENSPTFFTNQIAFYYMKGLQGITLAASRDVLTSSVVKFNGGTKKVIAKYMNKYT